MTISRVATPLILAALLPVLAGCNGGGVPDPDLSLERARELYRDRKPREALSAALTLARDPPLDLEGRVALADFLSRLSASERAVEVLDSWNGELGIDGKEVLARALLRSGDTARALNLLAELTDRDRGSARAKKLLGIAACSRKDWARADEFLQASRSEDARDPECWAWLGWGRLVGGDPEGGVRLLREALTRFPESWEIRSMLAAALFRTQGEDEFVLREVVDLTEWVAGRHPFDRDSRARLAAALGRLGRHARAVEVAQTLVNDYPGQVGYQVDLAIAQVRAGRPLTAVGTLERAAGSAPRDIRLLLNLGLAYLEASRQVREPLEFSAKAKAAFAKVRDIDAGNVDALIGLARSTLRPEPGNYDLVREAIGYYRDALKIDPDSFPANLNVALLYYDLTVNSPQGVQVRDDWFENALTHFRAAAKAVDVSEWDRAARDAFKALKEKNK